MRYNRKSHTSSLQTRTMLGVQKKPYQFAGNKPIWAVDSTLVRPVNIYSKKKDFDSALKLDISLDVGLGGAAKDEVAGIGAGLKAGLLSNVGKIRLQMSSQGDFRLNTEETGSNKANVSFQARGKALVAGAGGQIDFEMEDYSPKLKDLSVDANLLIIGLKQSASQGATGKITLLDGSLGLGGIININL